jgi:hypothetical protein
MRVDESTHQYTFAHSSHMISKICQAPDGTGLVNHNMKTKHNTYIVIVSIPTYVRSAKPIDTTNLEKQ